MAVALGHGRRHLQLFCTPRKRARKSLLAECAASKSKVAILSDYREIPANQVAVKTPEGKNEVLAAVNESSRDEVVRELRLRLERVENHISMERTQFALRQLLRNWKGSKTGRKSLELMHRKLLMKYNELNSDYKNRTKAGWGAAPFCDEVSTIISELSAKSALRSSKDPIDDWLEHGKQLEGTTKYDGMCKKLFLAAQVADEIGLDGEELVRIIRLGHETSSTIAHVVISEELEELISRFLPNVIGKASGRTIQKMLKDTQ